MNEKTPPSDERLKALVSALEKRAAEIDPQPLFARLQDRLSAPVEAEEVDRVRSAHPAMCNLAA